MKTPTSPLIFLIAPTMVNLSSCLMPGDNFIIPIVVVVIIIIILVIVVVVVVVVFSFLFGGRGGDNHTDSLFLDRFIFQTTQSIVGRWGDCLWWDPIHFSGNKSAGVSTWEGQKCRNAAAKRKYKEKDQVRECVSHVWHSFKCVTSLLSFLIVWTEWWP